MSEFWSYEPSIVRRQRQRAQWQQQAQLEAAQTVMGNQVADAGYDPTAIEMRPTIFTKPVVSPDQVNTIVPKQQARHPGGIIGAVGDALGTVGGAVDDAASTVFGGEVRQPWDVLRPVKRLMDAENQYIAQPVAKAAYEGVTGKDYEDANGIVKFGLETLASPSTYLLGGIPGLEASNVGKLGAMKLSKFALEGDSKLLGGAARLANAVTGAPPVIAGASSSAINGVPDQALRDLLGGSLPNPGIGMTERVLNRLKSVVGLGTPDQELATPIMNARKELQQTASSLAERVSAISGYHVKDVFGTDERGLIQSLNLLDDHGRTITNAAGEALHPTIQDVAAKLPQYDQYLNPTQRDVMTGLRKRADYYSNALKEQGVEFGNRGDIVDGKYVTPQGIIDGGFYLPRGSYMPKDFVAQNKVGIGGGRAGKAGYRKSAVFDSMAQGIDAGGTYEPFQDAFRGYANRAGNDAIDAYTANVFKNLTDETGAVIGQTPTDRLESIAPGLQQRVEDLRGKISGRLDTLVRQQTRGMADGVAEARLNRLQADIEGRVSKAMDAADASVVGSPGMVRAEATLTALDREANRIAGAAQGATDKLTGTNAALDATQKSLDAFRNELDGIKGDYAKALDRARQTPRDAGQIGLPQLQGTTFPVDIANTANKFLKAEAPRGELSGAAKVLNGMLRGVSATGDVSFLGIQGLLGLGHTPKAYGQAWSAAIKAMSDPDALAKALDRFDTAAIDKGLPTSFEWIKAGLHLGGSETEFQIGQRASSASGIVKRTQQIGNLPGLKQSNAAFGTFGDTLRLEAAQIMHQANPTADLGQLANAANLMTGWSKGKFLGDVGDFVQFAPRFFQSQLELVRQAIAGEGATAVQARYMLGKLMGIGALTTFGINQALGNQTDLNPTSSNFMRIRAAGKDISLFGPWDSLVRATVKAGQGDFEYVARTKASPIVRLTWDALTGKTFTGEPAVNPLKPGTLADPAAVESFLKNFVPINAQDVPGAVVSAAKGDTSIPNAIAGQVINTAGVKASPLSKADVLDDLSHSAYGADWQDLSPQQITALSEKYPDRIDAKTARAAAGVKETLKPYYALEDQVWGKVKDRPEFQGYSNLQDYVDGQVQKLRDMGVSQGQASRRVAALPIVNQLHTAVSTLRTRYRATHPDVNAALMDWYGATPLSGKVA